MPTANGDYYVTGLPTLSTTRPYWIYDSIINCATAAQPDTCKDVTYTTSIGYYLQTNIYHFARMESDGSIKFGKLDAKPTLPCNTSTVGKLVSSLSICLDGKVSYVLSGTGVKKSIGFSAGNIFGLTNGQSAVVTTVQNKSATLNGKYIYIICYIFF